MAARARRLGGGCILEARPGGGARLAWWATLDEPQLTRARGLLSRAVAGLCRE